MTKGARAMAGYVAASSTDWNINARDLAVQIGVSDTMVGYAKLVAEFAAHLIPGVIEGPVA